MFTLKTEDGENTLEGVVSVVVTPEYHWGEDFFGNSVKSYLGVKVSILINDEEKAMPFFRNTKGYAFNFSGRSGYVAKKDYTDNFSIYDGKGNKILSLLNAAIGSIGVDGEVISNFLMVDFIYDWFQLNQENEMGLKISEAIGEFQKTLSDRPFILSDDESEN